MYHTATQRITCGPEPTKNTKCFEETFWNQLRRKVVSIQPMLCIALSTEWAQATAYFIVWLYWQNLFSRQGSGSSTLSPPTPSSSSPLTEPTWWWWACWPRASEGHSMRGRVPTPGGLEVLIQFLVGFIQSKCTIAQLLLCFIQSNCTSEENASRR